MLTGAASRPSRASPTSAGRRACGRRTPRPRSTATLQHYMADPEVRKQAWRNRARRRRRGRPSPTPATARSSSSSARASCTRSSPRTSTACTSRRAPIPATVVEIHGTMREVEVHALRRARRRWSERSTACAPARRTRPAARAAASSSRRRSRSARTSCPRTSSAASTAAEECDVFLAVGTTLGVYPAADAARAPLRTGARLVIVNAEPTAVRRRSPTPCCGAASARSSPPGRSGRACSPRLGIADRCGRHFPTHRRRTVDTMMPSFRDLLAETKAEIREIDTADGRRRAHRPTAPWSSTSASPTSTSRARIPGAVHIPRGHLESQVESQDPRPRRAARRLLRRRRPLARSRPRRSSELGYTDVVSMAGGFDQWKNEGRDWITPADPHRRAAQPLPAPPPAARGRRGGPAEAARRPRCCCSARAASARPPRSTSPRPASARSASSTWTSSTTRTCSARSCTTSTASASARSTRPRRRSPR